MDPVHNKSPGAQNSEPDWRRFFPDADHRWAMGLRRGEAGVFLAPTESSASVCAERNHWLSTEPRTYAVLTKEAEPALAETVTFARSLGFAVRPEQSPRDRSSREESPFDQLLSLGRVWESDFVWLVADKAGTRRVAGGVVCFPSHWDLSEKVGRTLSETHSVVPGLNAALDRQIETFLDKIVPGDAWLRENAGFSRSPEFNQHIKRPRTRLDVSVTVDEVWIRLEHQMLLKLPLTHSILFGIRVQVVPLRQVLNTPYAATAMTRLLSTISPEAADYKGLSDARETIRNISSQATPAN
ncbi:MAG: DUF3445 domain-containing protein [Planctomyces sp.]|nr:DUF3445 domain-containing protein [Planctomyces sp.]